SRRGKLDDISLTLRAGEIVDLAGLVGAGRTELCRAIFGLDPVDSGEAFSSGNPVRIRSPREAVSAGIALLTEDRQKTGLALRLPISSNVTMANIRHVSRLGMLDLPAESDAPNGFIARLRIRAESGRQLAGRLCGGNQQKVVIAKWLFRDSQ